MTRDVPSRPVPSRRLWLFWSGVLTPLITSNLQECSGLEGQSPAHCHPSSPFISAHCLRRRTGRESFWAFGLLVHYNACRAHAVVLLPIVSLTWCSSAGAHLKCSCHINLLLSFMGKTMLFWAALVFVAEQLQNAIWRATLLGCYFASRVLNKTARNVSFVFFLMTRMFLALSASAPWISTPFSQAPRWVRRLHLIAGCHNAFGSRRGPRRDIHVMSATAPRRQFGSAGRWWAVKPWQWAIAILAERRLTSHLHKGTVEWQRLEWQSFSTSDEIFSQGVKALNAFALFYWMWNGRLRESRWWWWSSGFSMSEMVT